MNKRTLHSKKNQLLIVLSILVIALGYFFATSNTFNTTKATAEQVTIANTNPTFDLSVDNTTITTNDQGYATITGKTQPNVYVLAGILHTTVSNSDGSYTIIFPLKSGTSMDISLKAYSKNGHSELKTVTIKASDNYQKIEATNPATGQTDQLVHK